MKTATVEVECYSGYTYAQEPRAVVWRGERYQAQRVLKRWRTPAGPAFRVQAVLATTSNGLPAASPSAELFDLHYHESRDEWLLSVHTSVQEDQR
jgi:hypothetical protein